jgi:leader peptidase (prepilin peptidase)/N-methyltransferase
MIPTAAAAATWQLFPSEWPLLWPVSALALGLIVGSFANVCIHRLPLRVSVVRPASRCPRCARPIRAWENVPVLSFVLLRGRCRGCRQPVSWRYPLVEALNGAFYLALACRLPASPHSLSTMAFVTALLVLSLIDLEHYILPDVITLPGIALGLLTSLLPDSPLRPLQAVAAAVGGYLLFAALALAWKRLRGLEALGQGDWKMAAMLGAFLGWNGMLLTVFVASLAGTAIGIAGLALRGGSLRDRLPLGTFLGFSGIVVVFAGERVLAWYQGWPA